MYEVLLADNPGPMTLEGTNTYLVPSRVGSTAALIDPGPATARHLAAIREALGRSGRELSTIVLTHQHADHSELLATAEDWAPGVPVHAVLPEFSRYAEAVVQGQEIVFGEGPGDTLRVELTPGHTRDSISLRLGEVLFSGDTVLGRGTTVVTHPEGSLAAYLHSLDRLLGLARSGEVTRIAPGHGPVVEDPTLVLEGYVRHRHERLDQITAARNSGAEDVEAIIDRVYPDLDARLRFAARQSVLAQLEYLDRAI